MITPSIQMHNTDPYRRWLGIITPDRPLNAYQLLEISVQEDDTWLIESAASLKRDSLMRDRRRIPPETFDRMIQELDNAVETLTDPIRRQLYDQRLREEAETANGPQTQEPRLEDDFPDEIETYGRPGVGGNVHKSRRGTLPADPDRLAMISSSVQSHGIRREDKASQSDDAFQCSECGTHSLQGQRFCGKCGVAILQDCPRCETQTPIQEAYCVHCGVEIEAEIQRHAGPLRYAIEQAKELAQQRNYTQAVDIVATAMQRPVPSHPAIMEVRDRLQRRYDLYSQKMTDQSELATSVHKAAQAAIEQGDYEEALKQIGKLPQSVIIGKLREYYEAAVDALAVKNERKREAASAFRKKGYMGALRIVHELEQQYTIDSDMAEIRKRCETALQKMAISQAATGHYEMALEAVTTLIECAREVNSDHEKLHRKIEMLATVAWDVHNAPHVDETVVALAEWLLSAVPKDGHTAKSLQELKRRFALKKKSETPIVVPWAGSQASIATADSQWAFSLGNVEIAELARKVVYANPGHWNVAFGLALSGHNLEAVPINLNKKEPPKSTVMRIASKIRGSKSSDYSWGIDLGNYSLHAVRVHLDRQTGKVTIDRAIEAKHQAPLVNVADVEQQAAIVAKTLAHLSEHVQPKEHVVLNCSGTGTMHRLFQLPTVLMSDDDKLIRLVENEVRYQMPFGVELLNWDWHIMTESQATEEEDKKKSEKSVEVDVDDQVEQIEASCIVAAARKDLLEVRVGWLRDAGISVDKIQLDAIAIINSLAWQYGRTVKNETGFSVDLPESPIALLDIGHRQSTFVVARRDRVWIRIIPIAGNDFIHSMITNLKLTHAKAIVSLGAPPVDANFSRWSAALSESFGQLLHEIDKSVHQYRHEMENGTQDMTIMISGRPLQIHGLWRYLRTGR